MSRSFVGSSSSNTFGSSSNSRSSCSRRRSPPDRSPTLAVSRSPVKPKRSSIDDAVTSRPLTEATRRISSTESSTRLRGSRLSRAWVRCASRTVRPVRRRPACGTTSPLRTERTEVLPAPLAPIRPIRSPGPIRQVMRSTRSRPPLLTVTSSRSRTSLPSRAAANACSCTTSRGGGSSAMRSAAASSRNRGLEVRAGAPRRSQASSLRMRFWRRDSAAADCRVRSALARTNAAYPPA